LLALVSRIAVESFRSSALLAIKVIFDVTGAKTVVPRRRNELGEDFM
jgi:hypothetical protein